MPKKVYQGFVNQIKGIIDSEIGIMDDSGVIIACSDERKVGQNIPEIQKNIVDREEFIILGEFLFHKIFIRNKLEYIIYIEASVAEGQKYLSLISVNLTNMKMLYDEKYDKSSFIKDILNENILPGDIAFRAKELHISMDINRVAVLIKSEKAKDVYVYDIIQGMFPNKAKDFIMMLDDEHIVLIKELKASESFKEIEKTARIIVDTMLSESMVKTVVAIGTVVNNIADIKQSLKEAQIAQRIGEIFESEKPVISYSSLGVGRLIYELPEGICTLFLDEVFRNGPLELLDSEILFTIQKFFENNLNVSETSRQLYVHRNTLVYRLDKIQKVTGLDLRRFDDAIIFKFAMLVKRYIESGKKIIKK